MRGTDEQAPAGATRLSIEAIVGAARELIREQGVGRLTMRALAESLDVSPMATYHYVSGRDELLVRVVEQIVGEVEAPADEGQSWDDRLWAYMQAMRDALAPYPGIGDFLLDHEATEAGERYMSTCVEILVDGGFSASDAQAAFGVIFTYMWGGAVLLATHRRRHPGDADDHGAPGGAGPRIDELVSRKTAEDGYRTIVAGLRARRDDAG